MFPIFMKIFIIEPSICLLIREIIKSVIPITLERIRKML